MIDSVRDWPAGSDGVWRSLTIPAPETGGHLQEVSLSVDPPMAARMYRVLRESDGEVLANGGWTPSRDRPLRIFPVSTWVGPSDVVRFDVATWGVAHCEGSLTWA